MSAVEALRCAVEIQKKIEEKNALLPLEKRIQIRIGIHVGDVIQREVTRTIARKIRISLSPSEKSRLAGGGEVNPQVYKAYLKGLFLIHQFTEEAVRRGIRFASRYDESIRPWIISVPTRDSKNSYAA